MEHSLNISNNSNMKYECGEDLTMNNSSNPNFINNGNNGGLDIGIINNNNSDRGCDDNVIVDEYLSKIEVETKLQLHDDNINFIFPGKTKSNVWNLFRIIVYKDIRQNFVTCLACNCVLAYKSRTGTASLLRHNCYKRMQTDLTNTVQHFQFKQENTQAMLWNNNSTTSNLLQGLLKNQPNNSHGENHHINHPTNSLEIKCEPDEDDFEFNNMISNPIRNDNSGDNTVHHDYNNYKSPINNPELTIDEYNKDYSFLNEQHLTKLELEEKLKNIDEDIVIVPQEKMKSDIWKRFELIFYRGVRQTYVRCIGCHCILSYKKKTGSASLIRHKCSMKRKALPIQYEGGTHSSEAQKDINSSSNTSNKKLCIDENFYSNETISNALLSYLTTLPSTSSMNKTIPSNLSNNTNTNCNNTNVPKDRLTELAIQQIYFICKELGSIDIFNNKTFRNMMQILLNIGSDYGRQSIDNILANGNLINTMLNNMKNEIEVNIKNTVELNNNLSLTFNLWENYNNNLISIIGYIINNNYQLKKFHLGTEKLSSTNSIHDDNYIFNIILKIVGKYFDSTNGVTSKSILQKQCTIVLENDYDIFHKLFKHYDNKIYCSCNNIKTILEEITNFFKYDQLMFNYNAINMLLNELNELKIKYDLNEGINKIIFDLNETKSNVNQSWETKIKYLKIINDSFDYLTEYLSSISLLRLLENIDIDLVASFLNLVEPFQKCLYRLCCDDSNKTTINEVYLWKKKLEKNCQPTVDSNDTEFIKHLKENLLLLISRHFIITDYHKVALFMDPNFKNMKFLSQSERDSVIDNVTNYIDQMISKSKSDNMKSIDDSIKSEDNEQKTQTANLNATSSANDLFLEFMDCSVPDEEDDISKQEIRAYLDTRLSEPKEPLDFWKNDNSNLKNLRNLVRNVLNIPACSFGSKLKFSSSGKLLAENRSILKSDDLDCIMFLHQNI